MKFIPILFSADMVNATLEGSKTHARRVVKDHKKRVIPTHSELTIGKDGVFRFRYKKEGSRITHEIGLEPKAKKGDVFWVRENWVTRPMDNKTKPSFLASYTPIAYMADYKKEEYKYFPKIRPSIFMPKWACRIFLEVTDVRIERLQDIGYHDSLSEGVKGVFVKGKLYKRYYDYITGETETISPLKSFKSLWQSINAKKHPWDSNPFVWVYEFKQIQKPLNFK